MPHILSHALQLVLWSWWWYIVVAMVAVIVVIGYNIVTCTV